MEYLPLFFRLQDAPVLLVGGGSVALRKARLLSRAGARVRCVAPEIDDRAHTACRNVGENVSTGLDFFILPRVGYGQRYANCVADAFAD